MQKIMTKDKCYDWRHLVDTYQSIISPNNVVVEIGSSTAHRTLELSRHCRNLIGIEKFPERISHNLSSGKNNIRIINTDWYKLSKVVPLGSINIVVASHVIEHVKNDVRCLNETFKVLKRGGYLLFNTPNRKRLTRSVIELFTGERKFPYWEHMREYTRLDLEKLIASSKFSDSKVKITGFVLGIHGMGIKIFLKKFPTFLDKFSNFWEVLIQK
ncbi:MAG: hypothetical protein COX39_01105 [Candidatus Nealsonbacteria bacterium CG23_combo_of_CG06-09_8_20_14_all_40_13]|uniref:Methyltransferase type 11 domain-containing protein n=1 Tax=Candidatus Nealsonbacteria bacterium CG23_combo_of_CG06-09_8_20_14_all_40_13 TaxID=1974724 RepID=A0A2G9YRC7_9BACT|nr:MAG: hypothetical protein COX39_01105 [Candidatus Nealsonbacteria bacterium CG23_combo_of_CG06-09_8_20_14_all_40_13]PIR70796.1 MAG: hypothetical protein COU44_03130 [Candidatus Nealsonbacteria bacterium CG10_big_fil_rev_8_21_14_0_10_40_24]PIU43562.1 MAG: hypothetical protein COS97_00385 [Candidatus Nealsonbacteria bacterium CG07_land_8_20_14_0_80_40_10]